MITRLKRIKIICLLISFSILLIPQNSYAKKSTNKTTTTNKETADIYLNFENATLSSVVQYLSEQKKINIIPLEELNGIPVSLSTREPLTLNKSWDILLTLLEINGFTIIDVDGLYRIVRKEQNKQEPLPMYSGVEPDKLPDNDTVIRYIYFLKNIKAAMVEGFLATMLEGTVQTNEALDALIITDKCLSIRFAMKIIKELDQGGLREAIKIIKLKHSSSEDVAKLFEQITPTDQQKNIRFLGPRGITKKPSTYFSRDTRIIGVERNNSLILLGLEKNIDKVIDFIYKYIDKPIDSAESRLHIKELKYAKALTLKTVLENIIKPPIGIPKGEYQFFQDVIIAADASDEEASDGRMNYKGGGNRLIISCDNNDWKRLEKLINAIDKPQPQVAFEVMIVDVGLVSDFDLWSQFKPKKEGMFGKHVSPQFRTALDSDKIDLRYGNYDATKEYRPGKPATNVTFGIPGNLWGMIQAVLSKDNYNIILQPYITVNNNQECYIDSTQTRRVAGAFSAKQTGATSLVQEKETVAATTIITLTPKVNLNGMIDLKIHVKITDFISTTDTDKADTTNRDLNTRINVGTGEVIILGGLTKSNRVEKSYKVPILGDIPILGNLFKSKSNKRTKTNLYIFIRPSIIKPRFDAIPDEYTQRKLDYAKHQIFDNDTYAQEKDPIQRWFFKPGKQSVKQKLSDGNKGIFRPIDNYASGFEQPKSVDIKNDKYFRPEIKRAAKIKKAELTKKRPVKKSLLKRRSKLT